MNRLILALGCLLSGMSVGCKKEVPPPPPAPVEVVAPVAPPVVPGMETENPAEKEGKP